MRRHKPRVSNFAAGVIGAVVIAIACYLVFGGSLPFSGTPFQLKAVFTSETELHIPSPVRIAGRRRGPGDLGAPVSGAPRRTTW